MPGPDAPTDRPCRWGRYAELLAYNDRTASIDLENHTAAELPQW
jgi:hypothetical protein